MKAITLYQPYASLIACGVKTIETRSWETPYRGLLAIHAAKSVPREWEAEGEALCTRFKEQLGGAVLGIKKSLFGGNLLPMSVIVAVAFLDGCFPTNDDDQLVGQHGIIPVSVQNALTGNFDSDRFGWTLTSIRALKSPVAAKGQLGIWDVDATLEALIKEQL